MDKAKDWFELDDEHNTYVFVWNLPLSFTDEDFISLMKKYGAIKKKPEKGNPYNIKLYKDKETGKFKGEGLCCYAKIESVKLALELLDEYAYDPEHIIRCKRAEFKMKGDFDPTKKPKPLDKKVKDKQKKKLEKYFSWDQPETVARQKKVILKFMFVPAELEDPEALLSLKEDVEEGCQDIGIPSRIEICEKNSDGIVEVVFKDADQADKCVELMNGRNYAGRVIFAELWDGKTKYKIKETDEEAELRHKKFQEDLVKEEDEEET